ncbi:hypothetical protein CVT26_009964 [Gymnopilus dilepis]|uniref:Uncharacterized protein n=1 Tax=Gymnopilus dilepis TaxID=231916 RepID=A0A409VL93_9AGAR|nr:hypothetical protein CVT26_009964 [Gymnopilus dilepis]
MPLSLYTPASNINLTPNIPKYLYSPSPNLPSTPPTKSTDSSLITHLAGQQPFEAKCGLPPYISNPSLTKDVSALTVAAISRRGVAV